MSGISEMASFKNSTNVRSGSLARSVSRALWSLGSSLAPGVSTRLARKLFFTPLKPRPVTAAQRALLDAAETFGVRVNGELLSCWRWGDGPAVVLVHGWSSRGIELGEFVAPLVEAGFAVVTYDGPGHGLSGRRASSYFELTDALRAIVSSK